MEQEAQWRVSDQFDPMAMQAFRRRPDIYWGGSDAMLPAPEQMDFIPHMMHPDVWIVAATLNGHIFGFVEFNRRTSVMAEIHCGFHPEFRGRIALVVVRHAIALAFRDHGLAKLVAIIPSDHRPAIIGALRIGFRQEGRLTRAIVRDGRDCIFNQPPHGGLTDLLLLGLER